MSGILHDTNFWVTLAAAVFVAVAWKKGRAPLLAMLDSRTARIRNDLEEAARLRAEAEALLADAQKQHRDAQQTAQQILHSAREAAARAEKEAGEKLSAVLQRRESHLLDRIRRAEAAALQALRDQASTLAARAAEALLHEKLAKNDGRLVDEAIRDLPGRLN